MDETKMIADDFKIPSHLLRNIYDTVSSVDLCN